jgi:multidrug efflux system outer membrane protein
MRAKRSTTAALVLIASAFGLTACMTLKPERTETVDAYVPDEFSATGGDADLQTRWWLAFESDQLNHLMDTAFAGNLTLEKAVARIQQAEAAARKAGAAGRIHLGATADASSRTISTPSGSTTDPNYGLGLSAAYEVDLWGRIRSSKESALASWEASKFDLQTAAITLSAELGRSYFNWLAQNEILALYQSQLAANNKKLSALETRFQTGQSSALAVLQQREQVAAAEARIPPVRALINTAGYNIAVLTGRIPGSDLGLTVEPLPQLPAQPSTGLPIALLENRPDLQSARLALESSDWTVSQARAARLPSIALSANASTDSGNIDQLFDDWSTNLAANLIAPIIDGGARQAEVDRAMAVSREKIAAYRLSVLEAIQDTEDALSSEQHQRDYVEALARQYTAARTTESESIRRYQHGMLPYLDALIAIVSRETLEITHVQAKAILLGDRIQLYRALGGDWTFILETHS